MVWKRMRKKGRDGEEMRQWMVQATEILHKDERTTRKTRRIPRAFPTWLFVLFKK